MSIRLKQFIQARCLICFQSLYFPHHGLCSICINLIPSVSSPCVYCGLPTTDEACCYRCQKQKPLWQRFIAVSPYSDPLKWLVHRFKFNGRNELGSTLARLMVLRWLAVRRKTGLLKPDVVLPVPLTGYAQWRRGYNQAALLAKPIARMLQTTYDGHALIRKPGSDAQKKLRAFARKKNVSTVFRCDHSFENKRILLVDDIVTTGATLSAVCEQLWLSKPREIHVICVCRTL